MQNTCKLALIYFQLPGAHLAPCSRWYQSGIKRSPVIRVKRCRKSVVPDLRRAKADRSILGRPGVSGDLGVLQAFCRITDCALSLRTSLYRPGCSTVAVRCVPSLASNHRSAQALPRRESVFVVALGSFLQLFGEKTTSADVWVVVWPHPLLPRWPGGR